MNTSGAGGRVDGTDSVEVGSVSEMGVSDVGPEVLGCKSATILVVVSELTSLCCDVDEKLPSAVALRVVLDSPTGGKVLLSESLLLGVETEEVSVVVC